MPTLLRNIGNVFKRPDEAHTTDSVETPPSIIPPSFSAKLLGASTNTMSEETPDLYYEDRALGHSIHGLEEVRLSLRDVAAAANEHKEMLVAVATSERALGEVLGDVMRPVLASDDPDDFEDLTLDAEKGRNENVPAGHFSSYLPADAREAQMALGRGLTSHSDATVKLSVAMSTPINDLERSFEERYLRKIVPLKRRYMDQKGQYLKYKRHADMAENDEKRSYYEALAEAAKPVWMRTSTELRTESDVMTELTAKNLAKWSRSLALQHERALAIAAANFADAFNRAKTLNSLGGKK